MTALAPPKPVCKLCQLPAFGSLYSGARFGVVGQICMSCWRAQDRERCARARLAKLATTDTPYRFREVRGPKPRPLFLEVLDPDFDFSDLTPRAAVRAILASPATRRVFFHRSPSCSGGRLVPAAGAGALPVPAANGAAS